MVSLFLSIFWLFSFNLAVQASDSRGTDLAKLIEANQFRSVGKAKFTVLFWDIYQSQLFYRADVVELGNNNQPLLFEIQYLKDITRDELIIRTIEQWQHLGVKEDNYQVYLPALKRLWPNIKAGDSLAILINQTGSSFYFNENKIGTINEPEFGWLFVDIWLSPNTSQPKLRRQLLGRN